MDNYNRAIDIKIASLLGHYKEVNNRGWYSENPNSTGYSMAMAIFNKPVNDKHIWDLEGNRRWWKDELYIGDGNERWYTSAVPRYQSDIKEAWELLHCIHWKSDIAIYNIGYSWNVTIQHKDDYEDNYNIKLSHLGDTISEAICGAFILYKETMNEITKET